MLARWIERQEVRGNRAAAEQGRILLERDGDFPLLEKERANTIHFSAEQHSWLERKGYFIYSLTGQTIATLCEAGHPFKSTWHQGKAIEHIYSKHTEVAVNPNSLFLKNSNCKDMDEQLIMVEQFARMLGKEIMGVTAILGNLTDYADLTFSHLVATGNQLFGKNYFFDYTRTTTPISKLRVVAVGGFGGGGLNVDFWERDGRDSRHPKIWAAPLVVPAAAVGL